MTHAHLTGLVGQWIRRGGMKSLVGLTVAVAVWSAGCSGPEPKPLPCLERAVFGDPAESPYVLPYPVGRSYRLAQAYCYPRGGHRNQLAYDFDMPIGEPVVAARAGVVRRVLGERFGDMPMVFVVAPVCRPGWLVELECLAVVPQERSEFAPF